MLICKVNNLGEFTFLNSDIQLPDEVPKVKHPSRELHPHYILFLRREIEERVKLKIQINNIKLENDREKKILNSIIMKNCQRNIEKIFNV